LPVKDFFAGGHLQRSDIVLCRGRSLFSKMIRWTTRSYFSHAALIFLVPEPNEGFDNTFVLEAIPTGVTITNMHHYVVERAKDYDIVIKRVEKPWFTEDVQRLVRGHMLDFVRAEYDFHAIGSFAMAALRSFLFGVRVRMSGLQKAVEKARTNKKLIPTRFVCSGFVQYGYIAAARWLASQGKLNDASINDVIFSAELDANADVTRILATTPEEVASSNKSTWKYVVTKGKVYSVSTSEEVAHLLGSKKVW